MKPPPLLLTFALVLWGWQTGLLAFALLMAVVLEAARWIEWRVDFGVKDFNRIVDLAGLLAVIGGIYCVLTREATNQVMAMLQATNFTSQTKAANAISQTTFIYFQWFPMILFPVVAALTYSTSERYPWSCFFYFSRRRAAQAGAPQPTEPGLGLAYPYLAVVLFSASLANQRNDWFYFAASTLIAFALWSHRPQRFRTFVWFLALLLVVKVGYHGFVGLNELQSLVENKLANWVSRWTQRSGDRHEAATAIGRIGPLKLSGKIVMRVEAETGPVPMLLRDTAFNRFESPRWSWKGGDPRREEKGVTTSDDGTTWPLLTKLATNQVRISTYTTRGQAVLSTPPGTASLLFQIPPAELKTNSQGTIRVLNAPDFLQFTALHGPGDSVGSPPNLTVTNGAWDLYVPVNEIPKLDEVVKELVLRTKSPTEKIHAVRQFFSQNFKYGSFLPDSLTKVPQGYSALGFFLTKNRVGHCEYYATATALLLRHLDIPARYVYGWSVQEAERGSDTFIVRERHAHAWCIYWDDAQKIWADLDTTPSEWAREEAQNASFWEPLTDRWSRAVFAFSKWRYYGGAGDWQNYFLLALLALIGLLAWRLLARQRRRRRAANETSEEDRPLCPGLDSEFYQIEQQLDQLGLGRRVGEPLAEWLTRIEPLAPRPLAPLRALLMLHYRLRFDPRGLSEPERAALRSGVGVWLTEPKAV